MRLSSLLILLVAAGMAIASGYMAQTWLEQQRQSGEPVIIEKRAATTTIVVANEPLRFGTELSPSNVREIEWPAASAPDGTFISTAELLGANERRVVLSAIETNEPILKWKITGPGQRASLSSVLKEGMKAVTIRVNDVNGIAGFVLPGDRVDVLLTRTEPDPNNSRRKKVFNDVILQNVRVLGVDQLADDRTEQPKVAKAVTLEVSTADAQRVALASNVGSLSLVLRSAGFTTHSITQRISDADLDAKAAAVDRSGKITVTRGLDRTEYTVSPYSGQSRLGRRTLSRSPREPAPAAAVSTQKPPASKSAAAAKSTGDSKEVKWATTATATEALADAKKAAANAEKAAEDAQKAAERAIKAAEEADLESPTGSRIRERDVSITR